MRPRSSGPSRPVAAPGGGVAVQPDGKIVVVGSFEGGSAPGQSTFAIRYNVDGSRDTNFAVNGLFTSDFGSSDTSANSLVTQTDGKLVLGGYSFDGTRHDLAVRRLSFDGTIDTTFGNSGWITADLGVDSGIDTIVLQSNGAILAGAGNTGPRRGPRPA